MILKAAIKLTVAFQGSGWSRRWASPIISRGSTPRRTALPHLCSFLQRRRELPPAAADGCGSEESWKIHSSQMRVTDLQLNYDQCGIIIIIIMDAHPATPTTKWCPPPLRFYLNKFMCSDFLFSNKWVKIYIYSVFSVIICIRYIYFVCLISVIWMMLVKSSQPFKCSSQQWAGGTMDFFNAYLLCFTCSYYIILFYLFCVSFPLRDQVVFCSLC